jgi:hypothetical protein
MHDEERKSGRGMAVHNRMPADDSETLGTHIFVGPLYGNRGDRSETRQWALTLDAGRVSARVRRDYDSQYGITRYAVSAKSVDTGKYGAPDDEQLAEIERAAIFLKNYQVPEAPEKTDQSEHKRRFFSKLFGKIVERPE